MCMRKQIKHGSVPIATWDIRYVILARHDTTEWGNYKLWDPRQGGHISEHLPEHQVTERDAKHTVVT